MEQQIFSNFVCFPFPGIYMVGYVIQRDYALDILILETCLAKLQAELVFQPGILGQLSQVQGITLNMFTG